MAVAAVPDWSFHSLVGAFVDLVVAYCLLSFAALAFLASKVSGVFGLCLPCIFYSICSSSCDPCLHQLLVDYPKRKISSVQLSARTRFPFHFKSTRLNNHTHLSNLNLIGARPHSDGIYELEDEASSSSFPLRQSGIAVEGEGIISQKTRSRIRRGHRDYHQIPGGALSTPVNGGDVRKEAGGCSDLVGAGTSGGDVICDYRDAPTSIDLSATIVHGSEITGVLDEKNNMDRDLISREDLVREVWDDLSVAGNDKNTIRILERALGKAQATCDTLHLELEKERASAATAANEAMAMILHLQKDKALMKMEARQYQRMIEEKSAYIEEEMYILKEIIVQREKEMHLLEKELEAYRKMVFWGCTNIEGDWKDMTGVLEKRQHAPYISTDLELTPDLNTVNNHYKSQKDVARDEKEPLAYTSLNELEHSSSFETSGVPTGEAENLPNRQEIYLDTSARASLICEPQSEAMPSSLGRNLASRVDNQRLKDNWLERVQKEREKLNLSSEHIKGEKSQLKLLEAIANHLHEIQRLTESGKVLRHASLPSSSTKELIVCLEQELVVADFIQELPIVYFFISFDYFIWWAQRRDVVGVSH